MTKRIVSLLLIALMLVTCIPFTVSAATKTYKQSISAYNSTRYENYLVIYSNSGTKTGTNAYGYEVVVTDGIVTDIGLNNATVPAGSNSFVASGHGTMKEWLQDNIIVGMKASYSTSTDIVTFIYDDTTPLYGLNLARDKAIAAKANAKEAALFYDETADADLETLEEEYASLIKLSSPSTTSVNNLITKYTKLISRYTERAASEYRGVWIRPKQTNYSQVENYVKRCYDAGLNMISVETMYNSTMIYPTPKGSLFEHNPVFYGFDVLDAYITACHKYGMELHVWMPVFYSADVHGSNWKRSVAYKKPEWRLTTNNGDYLYTGETSGGMAFLNPALPEVQDFLAETYTYILENYDIDGFQLDYIRYRDANGVEDYGYDEYTISEFKKAYPAYKYNPIKYNTNAMYWDKFVAFRAAQVTKFVERMRNVIDTVAPDVLLSADVGVSKSSAYNHIYQDYETWLEAGWLDMIHPMAYGTDYSPLMYDFFDMAGEECLVVPGLGTYMEEFNSTDMLNQTREMLEVGCAGVVYFESESFFTKGCGTMLTGLLFTNVSTSPALELQETFETQIQRIADRLALAKSAGTITSSVASSLTSKVNALLSLESAGYAYDDILALCTDFKSISNKALLERLTLDLDFLKWIAIRDLRDISYVYDSLPEGVVSSDGKVHCIYLDSPTKVSAVKSYLIDGKVMSNDGKELGNNDNVFTDCYITNGATTFYFALKGDVIGDGNIDIYDYLAVRRQYLGTLQLNHAQTLAATVSGGDEITIYDYMMIRRHVLNTLDIYA